jgi:uncharacterized protein DUF4038/uncharacterized protein DUF5060
MMDWRPAWTREEMRELERLFNESRYSSAFLSLQRTSKWGERSKQTDNRRDRVRSALKTKLRVNVVRGFAGVVLVFATSVAAATVLDFSIDSNTARLRGVHEIELQAGDLGTHNPWMEVEVTVEYTLPDGTRKRVDGFYDGKGLFKARAYCCQVGRWKWRSHSSLPSLDGRRGEFEVISSDLQGKLRKHPEDPRQFARDNGDWFLHIGDTGYRYVTATEPHWKAYIDQAAKTGVTKVRTWFCQGRGDVQVLFDDDRKGLNLAYWQEIDRRLLYALSEHPEVVFQLIPYGEDTQELLRYGDGDRASRLVARYGQARFSALPNVTWCISNDREIVTGDTPLKGRRVPAAAIDMIGRDMAAREPWGTLLTNHQSRFSGYAFTDAPWSDIVTIEDLDQVTGKILLDCRTKDDDPVVNDEDRYELYRSPKDPRYFFRRLMWASLFSGGHATYGGLKTYEPYDGRLQGIQGYLDAVRDGKLKGGAADFRQIHRFFSESGLTLVGMTPDDESAGNEPLRFKCIRNEEIFLVYLANPDGEKPETDRPSGTTPTLTLQLPPGNYQGRWFNPVTGAWSDAGKAQGPAMKWTASGAGDWVLVVGKEPR